MKLNELITWCILLENDFIVDYSMNDVERADPDICQSVRHGSKILTIDPIIPQLNAHV